jgi:hypothetical protein
MMEFGVGRRFLHGSKRYKRINLGLSGSILTQYNWLQLIVFRSVYSVYTSARRDDSGSAGNYKYRIQALVSRLHLSMARM